MINKPLIYLFALFTLPNFAFSQLDIAELKLSIIEYDLIETDSTISESPFSESMITKTYASSDSLEIYTINYSFDGEIMNSSGWDVAIMYHRLDSLGRRIEFSKYEKDGKFAIRDIPPIIETIYLDSISVEQINYLNGDRSLETRMELTYDDQGRTIEMRWYDKNFNFELKTTYDFDDENRTRTEKNYDAELELETLYCGVAVTVVKYPISGFTENRNEWLEERFYDTEMNLVDCAHSYDYDKSFSIMQRTPLPGNKIRVVLLNAKNEIVQENIVQLEQE